MRNSFNRKELWLLISPCFVLALAWTYFSGRSLMKTRQAEQHVLDVKNGRAPRAVLHQNGSIYDLVFSPDGKLLASGEMVVDALRARNDSAKWIVSQTPPETYLWNVETGKLSKSITGQFTGRRYSVSRPLAFLSNAKVLVLRNPKAQIWNLDSDSALNKSAVVAESLGYIQDEISVSDRENIRLDAALNKIRQSVQGKESWIDLIFVDCTLSSENRFYAVAYLGKEIIDGYKTRNVGVWNVKTGRKLWDVPVRFVNDVAFSPDKKTLFAVADFREWMYDWGPRPTEQPYGQHGEITAFDISTGKMKWTQKIGDALDDIEVSPDGKLIACRAAFKYKTFLLNAQNGKLMRLLEVSTDESIFNTEGRAIKFSPDGKTLATHDAQNIYLWNIGAANLR